MILLIMGVAGSGKSTAGSRLAAQLGWTFLDADDFHSPENKAKMRRGIHLAEDDRIPWLQGMHAELVRLDAPLRKGILAKSDLDQLERLLSQAGHQDIRQSAKRLVSEGVTTAGEIEKVCGPVT